ncbi:polymorphic toxin type 17 domain-containing protein [Hahella sp. SMD15-11]|uniref:Polymorphic toxin type 17 domain-containing protein n=1 Tax=Thermohahella caldifontis TaxID=3142973 RepID=A0AB39UW72_9GAMM
MAAEYDDSGSLIAEYHYTPGLSWMTAPVYQRRGGQVVYYINDHLGTPIRMVAKNGAIVWQADYSAFGQLKSETATIPNPLRFPGQYHDPETGLYHNTMRDYDPELGRYLQRDPIGLAGGLNVYGYAYQNPLAYFDPTGEVVPAVAMDYARCLGGCLGGVAAGYVLEKLLMGCDADGLIGALGGAAAGCALGGLNPLKWFKGPKGPKLDRKDNPLGRLEPTTGKLVPDRVTKTAADLPFDPRGTAGTAKAWTSIKGRLKAAELPTTGKIRFVPRKGYDPANPLARGPNNGYLDRFGNEWTKGPSRTQGQTFEWDVQLSKTGKSKLGWVTRDGSHANVSLDGRITRK